MVHVASRPYPHPVHRTIAHISGASGCLTIKVPAIRQNHLMARLDNPLQNIRAIIREPHLHHRVRREVKAQSEGLLPHHRLLAARSGHILCEASPRTLQSGEVIDPVLSGVIIRRKVILLHPLQDAGHSIPTVLIHFIPSNMEVLVGKQRRHLLHDALHEQFRLRFRHIKSHIVEHRPAKGPLVGRLQPVVAVCNQLRVGLPNTRSVSRSVEFWYHANTTITGKSHQVLDGIW
mmetsp:Transcript_20802/g.35039  ORF Transcript_20802/g.35039 Transcript_20802/m.35039 type:complete len:233 (-) Transcript_20802:793-1491(-)